MSRPTRTAARSMPVTADPIEVELKFALPCAEPAALGARLAALPCLASASRRQQQLDAVYFDTPDQALRKARMALRVRRSQAAGGVRRLQALKTAAGIQDALARRGEWETPVVGDTPDWGALQDTPWLRFDPLGAIFQQLEPAFRTRFQRTSWQVGLDDGASVEVALDIGAIESGNRLDPICELELELLSGSEASLFRLAQTLAAELPMLPSSQSKAERGWCLVDGARCRPRRAAPLALDSSLELRPLAAQVLLEMFGHFTDNLARLPLSPEPELLHQARVGWRRLRSGLRLFRPVLPEPPSWAPLRPLLSLLGQCRDADVVRKDVLAPLAERWIGGDARRKLALDALDQGLAVSVQAARASVLSHLQDVAVSSCLLDLQTWLHGLARLESGIGGSPPDHPAAALVPRDWVRHRLSRLDRRLQAAASQASDVPGQHRVRILAKRLRYGAEALSGLLPLRTTRPWHERALVLQTGLGEVRDLDRAVQLAVELSGDPELVAFLRGVAVGRTPRA